jgi:hypothetical protein
MIPSVFITSTIADLQHLREAIKETIEELAYRPVLSEFGDIGYLPRTTAEDSCYQAMRDCQIAVLIVGKRYGDLSVNGYSVTHNEFLTARAESKPVVCLADREVLSFKKVFDQAKNSKTPPDFPEMDSPSKTFTLLHDLMNAPVNNGILPYGSVAEAKKLLKTQLAHIFGDLLRVKSDPVKAGINDVLSEIMTLRQELRHQGIDSRPFLRTIRFLLDDANSHFRDLVRNIDGDVEFAVPRLLESNTFDEYLEKAGITLTVEDKLYSTRMEDISPIDVNAKTATAFIVPHLRIFDTTAVQTAVVCSYSDKNMKMNETAKTFFDEAFSRLKETIRG